MSSSATFETPAVKGFERPQAPVDLRQALAHSEEQHAASLERHHADLIRLSVAHADDVAQLERERSDAFWKGAACGVLWSILCGSLAWIAAMRAGLL